MSGKTNIVVRKLDDDEKVDRIHELASLRIEVFREFPYLYDGSISYEEEYLNVYLKGKSSLIVGAFLEDEMVGASTGILLSEESEIFQKPFMTVRRSINDVFYFGESVLKKEYRGLGLGHKFFDYREEEAMKYSQIRWTTFCAIQRSENDSKRPTDYRPLNSFWTSRGYRKDLELETSLKWKEVDTDEESNHQMYFWTKKIRD